MFLLRTQNSTLFFHVN